jgi:hypothetical protein
VGGKLLQTVESTNPVESMIEIVRDHLWTNVSRPWRRPHTPRHTPIPDAVLGCSPTHSHPSRRLEDVATSTSTVPGTDQAEPALRAGAGLMTLAAVAFIGYGGIFFVRNFSNSFLELGIGPAQVDVGKAQIQAFSPSLAHYISHLHLAVAGFVAATGLAVAVLSWFGVRRGHLWAWVGAVAAPVLALAVALPAHYPYHLDTLGHLGPDLRGDGGVRRRGAGRPDRAAGRRSSG